MTAIPQALASLDFKRLDSWRLKVLRRRLHWLEEADPWQVPPDDGWTLWLFMAGRGSGKTRTAAEHSWWRTAWRPRTRWLVAAPTSADIRDTCFEGESGILACIPSELILKWNRSLNELELRNGSILMGRPLSEPDRQRGPQWHGGWIDELAATEKTKVNDAWKNLVLAVRLPGYHVEKVVTTTPKPIPLMMELSKRKDVVVTRASTYDNAHRLDEEFKNEVLKHEGTKYGDQEIYGALLDPEEAGIIKRSWFKLWKHLGKDGKRQRFPRFKLVVQSYDTAFGEKQTEKEDFTAAMTFGVFEWPKDSGKHHVMLVDAWQDKLGYPQLREKVTEEFAKARYGEEDDGARPSVLLIEQKSSGISLIQDLNNQGIHALGYNPGRLDKFQRLNLVSYIPYHGLVHVPESTKVDSVGKFRQWADEPIQILCSFPQVLHDDYVDAFSQALQYLADQGWLRVDNKHVVLPEDKDYHASKKRGLNPYVR